MDEAEVYEIINKEMGNGKRNGCSNEYVVHRILYKIQAYVKEARALTSEGIGMLLHYILERVMD
jgi:hypothetical protein